MPNRVHTSPTKATPRTGKASYADLNLTVGISGRTTETTMPIGQSTRSSFVVHVLICVQAGSVLRTLTRILSLLTMVAGPTVLPFNCGPARKVKTRLGMLSEVSSHRSLDPDLYFLSSLVMELSLLKYVLVPQKLYESKYHVEFGNLA